MPFRSFDEEQIRFAAKAALRERLTRIRRALPREAAAARDARIQAHCLSLIERGTQGPVGSYLPMKGEISTEALHEKLFKNGISIALPTVEAETSDDLCWRIFDPNAKLVRHPLGFNMPARDAMQVEAQTLRWVLIPCLAVDERGFRLGWGGGFYDRALDSMKSATLVALAYDFQLMAELPTTAGDRPVDWIVTGKGPFKAKSDLSG